MKHLESNSGSEQTKLLLRERKRDLHSLEIKRGRVGTPATDYLSCRRSLLQAINELETLLRASQFELR